MKTLMFLTGVLGCTTLCAGVLAAESDDGWGDAPSEESAAGEVADEQYLEDEETSEVAEPAKDPDKGLHEDPDDRIFAVGARLRWIMIPEWFIKMFGVETMQSSKNERGLPLISNVGVGPEFIYRKDGFDITAAVWYVGLGWNDISMKGKNESEGSWEVIENNMRGILFTADFIWSTDITDWVAITYGAGLGLGVRWGDVTETEAKAPDYLEKCDENLDIGNNFGCQPGEDYNKTYDKFHVFPWVEFLVGARFKPHRHMSIYVDGGFSLGFQVGLRTQYIF
jgi:hypothetical protein